MILLLNYEHHFQVCLKPGRGACDVAQWLKVLFVQSSQPEFDPDDSSSVPRIHINVEWENLLHSVTSNFHMHVCVGVCAHAYT